MKLTEDQVEILKNGKLEDNKFYLPGQLERKKYLNINEVLNTIGLIWTKGKKAHIFDGNGEDLKEALYYIIETGEVETLKETIKKFQFYPTPKEVAEYLVELANIKDNERVLEPSAGLGNIAELIPENLAITLIELDKNKYDIIANKFSGLNKLVLNMDFLEYNGGVFDKVVANPPFSKSQDVKHILHMYDLLEEGGRLVSIASNMIQHKTTNLHKQLRELNPEFIELPEGSFKESGTMVNSVIVVINK